MSARLLEKSRAPVREIVIGRLYRWGEDILLGIYGMTSPSLVSLCNPRRTYTAPANFMSELQELPRGTEVIVRED